MKIWICEIWNNLKITRKKNCENIQDYEILKNTGLQEYIFVDFDFLISKPDKYSLPVVKTCSKSIYILIPTHTGRSDLDKNLPYFSR